MAKKCLVRPRFPMFNEGVIFSKGGICFKAFHFFIILLFECIWKLSLINQQPLEWMYLSWIYLFIFKGWLSEHGPKFHPLVPEGPPSPWQPCTSGGSTWGRHCSMCLLPGSLVRWVVQPWGQQVEVSAFVLEIQESLISSHVSSSKSLLIMSIQKFVQDIKCKLWSAW